MPEFMLTGNFWIAYWGVTVVLAITAIVGEGITRNWSKREGAEEVDWPPERSGSTPEGLLSFSSEPECKVCDDTGYVYDRMISSELIPCEECQP